MYEPVVEGVGIQPMLPYNNDGDDNTDSLRVITR